MGRGAAPRSAWMAALALLLCAAAVVVVHAELESTAVDAANAGMRPLSSSFAFPFLFANFAGCPSDVFPFLTPIDSWLAFLLLQQLWPISTRIACKRRRLLWRAATRASLCWTRVWRVLLVLCPSAHFLVSFLVLSPSTSLLIFAFSLVIHLLTPLGHCTVASRLRRGQPQV